MTTDEQIEELQSSFTNAATKLIAYELSFKELNQQIEELKRDKERLDWVERHGDYKIDGRYFLPDEVTIREAIDAAMQQEKSK